MDILYLLLFVYLCYRNSVKAKAKGYRAVTWGVLSFIAIFFAYMIGYIIVVFYFCRGVIDINRFATDPSYKDIAAQQIAQTLINNPLRLITILICSLGGYLFVRYIIEKKAMKGKPDSFL